ncbi:MAG: hypothetical protein H8E85_07635 [Candidatus Marinimicrobia bacterium]|nr:hypothetical protein [Candidatus Neomarinimicrobiota bacterium]
MEIEKIKKEKLDDYILNELFTSFTLTPPLPWGREVNRNKMIISLLKEKSWMGASSPLGRRLR